MNPSRDAKFIPRRLGAAAAISILVALLMLSCARKEPEQTSTTNTTETRTVRVNRIDLGRGMTADRRVITTGETAFTPGDTVFAAVVLTAPVPAAQLTARWIAADGTIVSESTQMVTPSEAEEVTQFQMVKPAGLPPGAYKLEILVDGQVVSTKDFTVTAP